jgi:hypothetical protein
VCVGALPAANGRPAQASNKQPTSCSSKRIHSPFSHGNGRKLDVGLIWKIWDHMQGKVFVPLRCRYRISRLQTCWRVGVQRCPSQGMCILCVVELPRQCCEGMLRLELDSDEERDRQIYKTERKNPGCLYDSGGYEWGFVNIGEWDSLVASL